MLYIGNEYDVERICKITDACEMVPGFLVVLWQFLCNWTFKELFCTISVLAYFIL
jgi:hypothetical protein